jgi:hypothetical protein
MKIQDLQMSFKFYKIDIKFISNIYKWWETFGNSNQFLQLKIQDL